MSTLTRQTSRIYLWDNIKFFLIFLVVLGHFIHTYTNTSLVTEQLYTYILSFHMPTFLFISGIFSKKAIQENRTRKCFDLFVLYVVTKFFIFVSKIITNQYDGLSLFEEASVPWYAFALMFFFGITMYLKKIKPSYLFFFSILLGCICGYDEDINDLFVFSRILVFYPFFLCGYYFDAKKIAHYCSKPWLKFLALLFHICWILYLFGVKSATDLWHPLVTGREHFSELGIYYFWYRLLHYSITFVLIFSCIVLFPRRRTIFSKMGSRSIQVYATHRGIIYMFFAIFPDKQLMKCWHEIPLLLLLTISSVILTIILSGKWLEKPMQLILHVPWMNNEEKA